jgi:hypothetical protein
MRYIYVYLFFFSWKNKHFFSFLWYHIEGVCFLFKQIRMGTNSNKFYNTWSFNLNPNN